jgi:hypothetical protein
VDVERIERALREGPPDEPLYVSGSFRRSATGRSWLASAALAVMATVAIAIGSWVALNPLREGGVGTGPSPVLDAADLEGTWSTSEIAFQDWVGGLTERGFETDEIAAFLEHDRFNRTVRYELDIADGVMTIRSSRDAGPLVTLSSAPYSILADGRLGIAEASTVCRPTVEVALVGEQLTLSRLDLPNCSLEEHIASSAFFELEPYVRVEP